MSDELTHNKPMIEGKWTAYGQTYKARVSGAWYADGSGHAIEVETWEPDGNFWEPWCTATLNFPGNEPPKDCVWIKEYDDEGVTKQNLVKLGIIHDLKVRTTHSGFVDVHAYPLTEKGLSLWPECPWFDETGMLTRPLPQDCIAECTIGGQDNYEACKAWVEKLNLLEGLDLGMVRGHLLETGGWSRDELLKMTPDELAIKILWDTACTIRDLGNQDTISIWAEKLEKE